MEIILGWIADFGLWLRPWLGEIATAIIACLLVIFGADINRFMRNQLASTHFIVRTLAFILLNAFGYGFMIVSVAPYLAKQLHRLPALWLAATVTAVFGLIGLWAQRHHHV
ncbi:DUF3392 domain-containing protein [Photobacterium sp. GSS17]|uniref:DUF3392 domain-containing protein n=1 Tax=Photobacterium sp. GSS17 TaxID=3020715 RepID=UPI00235EB6AB|nr:DUF3392 domain-containing protein [Photobacterium sp. GSS17]